MSYEIMVDANVGKFVKSKCYNNLKPDTSFEIYINYLISRFYKMPLNLIDEDLLDQSNVGGNGDLGIDGIFIKINNEFVFSKKDVDRIKTNYSSLKIEYIFVQSKNKTKLDTKELNSFFVGIKTFMKGNPSTTNNQKILEWMSIKSYLNEKEQIGLYEDQPTIKAIYAYKGNFKKDINIDNAIKEFDDIIVNLEMSILSGVEIFDAEKIFKMNKSICEGFEVTISYMSSFELNNTENVNASIVLLCNAQEFLPLIIDDTNNTIRKELFTDNVRDYQGLTSINNEIYETINKDPSKFCLLNNGITIVCKSCVSVNRTIRLINPRIVNGCQTSSTLYRAFKEGIKLNDVHLIIKIISTDNLNIINDIVKGSNRQNLVYSESFEITKPFHKKLEEYVKAIQQNILPQNKIYYERRPNQFYNNESIPDERTFDLRILIQSYVSTFLREPHKGFEHEISLLEKFENKIFKDGDNLLPYYVSAKLYIYIDSAFKNNYEKYKYFMRNKYQIMSLFMHLVAGRIPSLDNFKKLEDYCSKILNTINNASEFNKYVDLSVNKFEDIKTQWIKEKGPKAIHSIKDNYSFDWFMLEKIGFKYSSLEHRDEDLLEGVVLTVQKDRNGKYFCYIKAEPSDVFVHEDNSRKTFFQSLKGKRVLYKILSFSKYASNPKGTIIKVYPKDKNV